MLKQSLSTYLVQSASVVAAGFRRRHRLHDRRRGDGALAFLQALRDRLQALAPDGATIRHPDERAARTSGLVKSLEFNLTSLSGISLLVGAVLVATTLATSVVQRKKTIAILVSLGASRAQLARSLLSEALVLGLLGGALGALAGDLEVEAGEVLRQSRGAGAEVQVAAGTAGAEEDGVRAAGGAHAFDIIGVGFASGAEAVGRKRRGKTAGPKRKPFREIARLVAGAVGFAIAEGHLGAQIVAQNFLHRGGPKIVE